MNKDFLPAADYFSQLKDCMDGLEVSGARLKNASVDQALAAVVNMISGTQKFGGKVIFIGNGGSAAIASHQAVDLWKNGGVPAVTFNDASLLTCLSNDCGYEQVFEKPVQMLAQAADTLVAISSSGKSPNILAAVQAARAKGLGIVTLSGFKPDNPLRSEGDVNFYVPADSYGLVEITHLAVCHWWIDYFTALKENRPAASRATF